MLRKSFFIATTLLVGSALALPAAAKTQPARGAVVFWLLDRNSDGAIERAEIEALRGVIFDAMDADQDGKLTKGEAAHAAKALRDRFAERDGKSFGHGDHKRWEQRKRMIARRFEDGPIAKSDFVAGQGKLFERIDDDSDGKISKEEFAKVGARGLGRLIPN